MMNSHHPRSEKGKNRFKRGGAEKISCLFLNVNGLSALLNADEAGKIGNHSWTYLSETMVSEEKYDSFKFNNRTNFVVHAQKPRKSGRPSGGQMFSVNKKFNALVLSQDKIV